jgi:hypothetical protein
MHFPFLNLFWHVYVASKIVKAVKGHILLFFGFSKKTEFYPEFKFVAKVATQFTQRS